MFRRPEYNVRRLAPSNSFQKNGDVRLFGVCAGNRKNTVLYTVLIWSA